MFKKPIVIFISFSLLLALVFCLLPINVFDGVIVYKQGLQTIEVETPLSLSYFVGLDLYPENMEGIEDFYLTTKGMVMAFIFIIGFPAIVGYRFHLKS